MASSIEIRIVASGAEQAARVIQGVAQAGAQVGNIVASGASQAQRSMEGLGSTAKRVFEVFAGVNLANVFEQAIGGVRAFAAESSKLAREQQLQEATFKSFAERVGVAGDALAAQIEKVAGGIIDSGDAMKIAMRGLSEGLQPQQIVQLTDAARQLAKSLQVDVVEAYRDLTEAIATGQSRRLKEIGITIDQEQALKDYATTIGTTAEALSTAGRTQALFFATMEKAGPIIESNRQISDEWGEALQRLAVQWQDVKETVGGFLNEAALGTLKWIQEVISRLPEMGNQLQQIKAIWIATGDAARAFIQDAGIRLSATLIPVLKAAAVAASAFGVGLTAGFSVVAGPLAYISSILDDLARSKWPSHTRATLEANVATAEARVRLAEAVDGFDKLRTGTTAAADATTKVAAAADLGSNKLGDLSKQIKATTVDTEKAAQVMGALAAAMVSLATQPGLDAMFPQQKGAFQLLQPVLQQLDQARAKLIELGKGLPAGELERMLGQFDEGAASLRAWAEAQASATVASRAQAAALSGTAKAWEQHELRVVETGDTMNAWLAIEQRVVDELQRMDDALAGNATGITAVGTALMKTASDADTAARRGLEALQEQAGLSGDALLFAKTSADVLGRAFSQLSPETQELVRNLAKTTQASNELKAAMQFQDTLAAINVQAQLLGDRFDAVGSTIGAMEQRLRQLAETSRGQVTPEMQALAAQLEELRQFQDLRDMFTDIFSSVGGAINTLVQGVILGTQTMGEAFKRLGQSIVIEFVNRVIQQALNPLIKAAANVVASLFTGGSGGGGVGGLLGSLTNSSSGGGGGVDFTTGSGFWGSLVNGAGSMLQSLGVNTGSQAIADLGSYVKDLSDKIGMLGDVVGLGIGIWQGIAGIQNGNALQAALGFGGALVSGYGLAASLLPSLLPSISSLLASALTAVAPSIAASLGIAAGAAGGAGGAVGGAAAGLGGLGMLAGLIAVPIIAALSERSKANAQADLEARVQRARTQVAEGAADDVVQLLKTWGRALRESNLPETLKRVDFAFRGMEELYKPLYNLGIGNEANIKKLQADLSLAWVGAMDAAAKRGIDTGPFTGVRPWASLGGQAVLGPEFGTGFGWERLVGLLEKIEFGFAQLEGFATPLDQIIPQYDRAIAMWSHLLGMDQALGPGRSPIAWQMGLPANPWEQGQELVRTGATIDLAKANAQLDREFRATSIQTVIQKLGEQLGLTIEQLLTPGLLSEQFARGMQPDIFTSDSGTPHVFQGAGPNAVAYFADIAAFADRLESAGFQPGEVGASIEKFLQSVDENVVNNPAWAHIHDLLSGAAFQSVDPNEVAGAISDLLAPLPTAIYDRVRGQAVALQDEMTTLLSGADATAEHVKARVERIKQELEAWSTITQLYTQLNAEIAALSGSLVRQTAAAIEAWRVQVKSFDDGITDLKESLELASGAGNAVALAQSAQALYEAEAQRYKATLEMVQQIQSTVLGAEKSIADLAGTFALIDLKAGDGTAFNRLLAGLNDLALTAGSAAERLFAVTTAVSNIAAAAPILAEQAGAAGDPSTYFRAIVTAATPALQVMNDLIAGASPGAERLGFLQQQAAMITQLGQAAVASVEAWAAAAIKAEQDRAQEEIDAVRAAAEARKAALQGEAAMVQEQIAATQKALAIAQAWESSLQSSQQFVLGLKLGEGSPLSQAQKLGLVRGNYQAALAAYMATPTAEGLSGLQGFAQQYLQVAGNTPALIAKIIADIEKAQALAPRGQVQVLEAQLEAQQLTLKSINDEITKIDETSAAQIKAIEEARDQNIASITARAKEIIDGINAQVTQALRDNADAQIAEQAKVLAEAKKLRDEVTGGLGVDSYLATEAKKHTELLRQIRDALSGVPQHQTGTWHAKRGLAFLHEGEIVATDPVDLVRRAARFVSAIAPVPVRADAGTRQTINVTLNYNGSGTADDAKRMVAVVVDELNRRARSGNGPLKGGVVRGVVKR